jgi:drug/metabolite transporter (DMT)-like permease
MKWAWEVMSPGQTTLLRVLFASSPWRCTRGAAAAAAARQRRGQSGALLTLAAVTDLDGLTAIGSEPKALAGVVVGLGLLGTGLAFLLCSFIVEGLRAVVASSSTYLPPVVALAMGWLVVDEPIKALDGVAVLRILGGVLTSAAPRTPRRRAAPAAVRSTSPSPTRPGLTLGVDETL